MDVYGVKLVNRDGSESGHSQRWSDWNAAAKFGETEVTAKRAVGFRVFRLLEGEALDDGDTQFEDALVRSG